MLAALHYGQPADDASAGRTNPNITFQIDGNLGTPAAVAEMIVQSARWVVRLLPRSRRHGRAARSAGCACAEGSCST